ncbi:sugar phosphate isomerase/epimerase [Paenibacillus sp. P96]|uniref:Sugar phosphate isomerase/epimerase n=1 Tax=Paenibacillus zeirhizosphaerae TaxID=2987519 RepID=A0ABT9FSV8_9BACL|nr:sugar phosphate isomerase/epimerase [Paenibacillus sp. P96]MDP4097822.1 sugar phosphate isomerase/epimerase [Paenibacillus sp. P96]
MKLSVFTVATPELTPEALVDAAREAGLDGVEWRYKEISPNTVEEQPSYWRNNRCTIDPRLSGEELLRFREITLSRELKVAGLMPYLPVGNLEAAEQAFHAASQLGAGMIRVGVAGYDGTAPYPRLYEETVRYLQEVEALAKRYGIKGLVETHHRTIAPSASLAYRLVSGCNPDYIGVLYDPGNMVYEGYEPFQMGIELLGPYLAHVHIKNAAWRQEGRRADGTVRWLADWSPLEEGMINYAEVLQSLKSVQYAGYLGIEDFSGQYDSRQLLKAFAKFIRERL